MTERRTSSGDVFLSHSSEDAAEVERLRAALEGRGIACFLDVLELKAGDDLAATLKERVQGAKAFLVVLSLAELSWIWASWHPLQRPGTTSERSIAGPDESTSPSARTYVPATRWT